MSAIQGAIARFSSLSDGTIRYVVDVSPADDDTRFHQPHAAVALALLVEGSSAEREAGAGDPTDVDPRATSAELPARPYAQEARVLRQSGFCRAPDVWRAAGSDAEFRAWVQRQPCIAPGPCSGDVVAAHVRRIADGAGTGIKPEYACVPLCHQHHSEQHQHGESRIARRETWDQWRLATVERWCWEAVKGLLGYEHWYDVPPAELLAWAQRKGVERYLPLVYRGLT